MLDFRQWLISQKFRDDPVGDLARDVLRDIWKGHLPPEVQTSGEIIDHIRKCHVFTCSEAIDAVRQARREFAAIRN